MMRATGFVLLALAGLVGSIARADPPRAKPGEPWTMPDGVSFFAGDPDQPKRIENMSGLACGPGQCLAVTDEGRKAQFFGVTERVVTPGPIVRLRDAGGTVDAEAVAATDTGYLIVGSHGLGRGDGTIDCGALHVFGLPGPWTGMPTVAEGSLVGAILEHPTLARRFLMRQKTGGLDIEGATMFGGRLFIGFRSPSDDADAYILSMAPETPFAGTAGDSVLQAVALADGTGIRDMAAVDDGILLLTGDTGVDDAPRPPPEVYFWDTASATASLLARIEVPETKGKAEGLLVFGATPETYAVAIMFDGPANGAPTEYAIPLPQPGAVAAARTPAPEAPLSVGERSSLDQRMAVMRTNCPGM